jgi:hypothetical protein
MTFEQKLVAGLEEIKGIVFECNECKSRIVISPDSVDAPPLHCPRNHHWDWNLIDDYDKTSSPFVSFLLGLKKIRDKARERSAGFKIFLEFNRPEHVSYQSQDPKNSN